MPPKIPEIKFSQDSRAGVGPGKTTIKLSDSQHENYKNILNLIEEYGRGKNKIFLDLLISMHQATGRSFSEENKLSQRKIMVDKLVLQGRMLGANTGDFYNLLLSELSGVEYTPHNPFSKILLDDLKNTNSFKSLFLDDLNMETKLKLFKKEIIPLVDSLTIADRKSQPKKKRKEGSPEKEKQQQAPQSKKDTSKPGMDEMEKGNEGELPPAIWTISPAYGGYFKECSFDSFNFETNTWARSYSETGFADYKNTESSFNITIIAKLNRGESYPIPIPYGFAVDKYRYELIENIYYQSNERKGNYFEVDTDNNYYINTTSMKGSSAIIQIPLTKTGVTLYQKPESLPPMPNVKLSLEGITKKVFEEIENSGQDDISKANSLARHTMMHLTYSNDSSFNSIYNSDPKGYFNAIDYHRQADCDVANTYFALLCLNMGIRARHVVGHMVKGKDDSGNSRITSGTGHAWTEVYNPSTSEWVRIDATPAGESPDEEEGTKDSSEPVPGDYGSLAVPPSEKYKKKLEEALEKSVTATSDELKVNEVDRLTPAEISLNQMRVLDRFELANGERLIDVISSIWDILVDSTNKRKTKTSSGYSQKQGGEEIDDIVAFKIERKAGNQDPAVRLKETSYLEIEDKFRDIDLYFGLDKSGSMESIYNSKSLLEIQREVVYILISSVQSLQNKLLKTKSDAQVRTSISSFGTKGYYTVDQDKEISNTLTEEEKTTLWKSLLESSGSNADKALIESILKSIKQDKESDPIKFKEKIKIAIFTSDGQPSTSEIPYIKSAIKELNDLGVFVLGLGITQNATTVPDIYESAGAKGKLVLNLNSLIPIAATEIVGRIVDSFPSNTKKQIEQTLGNRLAKLKNLF